jgi:hypothetical protein
VHGFLDELALDQGIVVKRDELRGGAVAIGVLAPNGDVPSHQQLLWPGESALRSLGRNGAQPHLARSTQQAAVYSSARSSRAYGGKMVRLARIELAASCSAGKRSIR